MNKNYFWANISDTVVPNFPMFSGNKEVDTVIIGGGISGITTATPLKKLTITKGE